MKAAEARRIAEKQAPIVKREQRDFEARQAAEKKAKEHAKRKKWREEFEASVRQSIEYAVKYGKTETSVAIDNYSSLDAYEELFEFKDDMKLVIQHLKRDGYTVVLTTHSYEVDDTAAYMNSGGECGSSEPYWTTDVVLKVSW